MIRILLICLITLTSCDQLINSLAKEAGKNARQKDSVAFEYNEKPVAIDRYDIIERKKVGSDSLFLVRGYFLNGKKYYDSWQKNGEADGITTFYFPSGGIQYMLEYKDSRRYTLINSFDESGAKNDGGNLLKGNGRLKIYHPITGSLIYDANYKNGFHSGVYLEYFSDGNKKAQMNFRNDSLFGAYTKFYHSGKLMERGNADIAKGTGYQESFFENGKRRKYEQWLNGMPVKDVEYDEMGRLIRENSLINGEYIGTNFFYNSEGKLLSKGQLYNNMKHGNYEYFYLNGVRKSLEVYKYDTIVSETNWFDNGKLSSESKYKNGLKTGWYREYYMTGNLKLEQEYLKGMRHGTYKSYFNNGKLYNDGKFKDDELTGELKYYSEKGEFKGVKKYP